MKFADLKVAPEIRQNLAQLGFIRPTDIQFKAIPPILKGEDVLAVAQTGTGKTAAFAIPVVHLIHQAKPSRRSQGVRCLVMVPTHELAQQTARVFNAIAAHSRVKIMALYGGVEQDPQIAQLGKGVDVLIATPGRMFDLVSQGHLDLSAIDILVVDEADHMLDQGFIGDIRDLNRKLPGKRQTLFFSATITPEIKKLAYSLVKDAIRIQISPKNPVNKNINHSVAYIAMDDKRFFLERVVKTNPGKKVLVFVRTKVRAERVKAAMARVEINSETIHSDKDQAHRNQVMEGFSIGKINILIATDVSARGIDIPGVDIVVNYDLPDKPENYVHRVGRTGRGNKRGEAVAFCSPEEKPLLEAIEDYTGAQITIIKIDKEEYQDTLDFSAEAHSDWKTLIARHEAEMEAIERKTKRKKAGIKTNNKQK